MTNNATQKQLPPWSFRIALLARVELEDTIEWSKRPENHPKEQRRFLGANKSSGSIIKKCFKRLCI